MAIPSEHFILEAPVQETEIVLNIAEDELKKVREVILKSFDIATTEDLLEKAEEHTEALLNPIKIWTFNIKHTTEQCKDNVHCKELRKAVDDTILGFKTYQPKVPQGITDYVDHVTKSSLKIIEQIKKISKAESKQVQDISKTVLDITKDSFSLIGNQIKDITQGKI